MKGMTHQIVQYRRHSSIITDSVQDQSFVRFTGSSIPFVRDRKTNFSCLKIAKLVFTKSVICDMVESDYN